MFHALGHMYHVLKHMYHVLKHMYHDLKHKIASMVRRKKYLYKASGLKI